MNCTMTTMLHGGCAAIDTAMVALLLALVLGVLVAVAGGVLSMVRR